MKIFSTYINRNFAYMLIISGSSMLLNGCLVGPKYERPEINTPDEFLYTNEYVNPEDSIFNLKWFDLFNDSVLIGLIDTAI